LGNDPALNIYKLQQL